MFTGIVEALARVEAIVPEASNKHFCFSSPISDQLKVDQSLSHSGVCLTVTKVEPGRHWVSAIDETLRKSNLGRLVIGDAVNAERSMLANGRFDGHIVQGHVDQVGTCQARREAGGSWVFDFEYDSSIGNITVEKGSICVNGVSLTCFNSREGQFSVAIIPYTYEHTNFHQIVVGSSVNLEFDILGKYIQRLVAKT
jgi:riboflavin synthase